MSGGSFSNSVVAVAPDCVVAEDGTISLSSFLPKSAVELLFFDTTLHSAEKAEYHLSVHNQGPLDPRIAEETLTSFRAGCSDENLPEYHPETMLSYGDEGNFDCKTVQVAAFTASE